MEDWDVRRDGRVVIVFSASNYYRPDSNLGAYCTVEPNLDYKCVTFASMHTNVSKKLKGKVDPMTMKIHALLKGHRRDLLVEAAHWVKVLECVVPLKVPWTSMRLELTIHGATEGDVDCVSTFGDQIAIIKSGGTLMDTVYRRKDQLEGTFRIMDADDSGTLTFDEVEFACKLLNKHMDNPFSKEDVEGLARATDINGDGVIDLNEFLESFRLTDTVSITAASEHGTGQGLQ
eukprot:Clim_evm13s156 gene=Clim_evmTU13s156